LAMIAAGADTDVGEQLAVAVVDQGVATKARRLLAIGLDGRQPGHQRVGVDTDADRGDEQARHAHPGELDQARAAAVPGAGGPGAVDPGAGGPSRPRAYCRRLEASIQLR